MNVGLTAAERRELPGNNRTTGQRRRAAPRNNDCLNIQQTEQSPCRSPSRNDFKKLLIETGAVPRRQAQPGRQHKSVRLRHRYLYFTYFCVETKISSTEAARHLGDVLARVKHTGESFILTKSDKPLARLVRFSAAPRASGAEIMRALDDLPWDPDFASDLERVNRMDKIAENPWG